jgi:exonuclease 1
MAVKLMNLLLKHRIKPYFVFEGMVQPAKLRSRDQDNDLYQRTARKFISILKIKNLPYVVALHEADAQLAYLHKARLVDYVLSEDSDMLPLGCKLLAKLDIRSETVALFVLPWMFDTALPWLSHVSCCAVQHSHEARPEEKSSSKTQFTLTFVTDFIATINFQSFLDFCLLCGSDYTPEIPQLGVKSLCKLFNTNNNNVSLVLANVHSVRKYVVIPSNYITFFDKAKRIFLYSWVYDPKSELLVCLHHPPSDTLVLNLDINYELGIQLAQGLIDPIKRAPYLSKKRKQTSLSSGVSYKRR